MRRLLAAAVAALLVCLGAGIGAAEAGAAPTLRSPGLRGVAKPIATKPPTAPPPLVLSANGTRPDVLVDQAGTAHVVWSEYVLGAPDATVYCRLPRGARGCEVVHRLVPPGADEFSQDVEGPEVLAVNDSVVVLSHRYPQLVARPGGGTDDDSLFMWSSDDGGQTFTEGGLVGAGTIGGDAAAFGPATSPSIGVVSGVVTGGVSFTAIQGGRYTPAGAVLAVGDYFNGRLAVQDGRPVVTYQDLQGTSYLRAWTGQGDPNDAATWTPPQAVPGIDPSIATAGGRLYMLLTEPGPTGRLVLRDVGTGAAVPVTRGRPGNAELLIGHADGRVSVVWQGQEPSGATGIWRRERILPGVAPRGAPSLVSTETGLFPEASEADDGGGVVVTDTTDRRILLSAYGTRAPTGRPGLGGRAGGGALGPDVAVACQRVRIGAVEALLQDGCFLAAARGRAKVSAGPMRLNGLEIVPDAGVQVIIDPAARTLRSTGTVTVRLRAPGIPDITLFRGSLQLDLRGKGVGDSLVSWTDGLFRPNLLGFPVRGDIDVRLTSGGVRIPVSLQLPAAFGSVRGAAELVADNRRGLVVDSLEFSADGVPLGPTMLRRMHVQYRAAGGTTTGDCLRPPTSGAPALPNEWAGVFELELPPPRQGPALCGSIRFGGGAFRAATFRIDLPPPGIVLFPGVSITALGGGLSLQPPQVAGTVRIGAVSAGGNASLVTLDGRLDARLSAPVTLRGEAVTRVAGLRIGDGSFTISADGYVGMRQRAGVELGPLAVRSELAGFVDAPRREFSLSGKGETCVGGACVSSGEAVLSTKGIAVCLPAPAVPRGAGYAWGASVPAGVDVWLLNCYASRYVVADVRQAAVEHAGAPEATAQVAAGAPDVTFRVRGDGGVPAVDLVAPSGAVVTPAATYADPASGTLYAAVAQPAAGTWTVRARPGSPLVAELATSRSSAPPAVTGARVTGRGRARVLRYRATIGEGQSITFVERGRAGARVLGAARAGARRLGFAPGPGPGGRREIVALLAQDGLVRDEVVVASYVAPAPPRPGRARGLRVRRAGRSAVATWRPGSAAAAQRLTAVIAGGQRVTRLLGGRARRAAIPGVRGRRVRVSVVAVAADGRSGRPAVAALAAARTRR